MAVAFPCLFCSKPVDPTSESAMMSPANKQWQHKDCCPEAVAASRGVFTEADGDRVA